MVTTKGFSELVGVSEQTIRNMGSELKPAYITEKGHRRYNENQIFEYFRLNNINAIQQNNVKKIVVGLNNTDDCKLLLYYLKAIYSDYNFYIVNLDENPLVCLNYIMSLGVFDKIFFLNRVSDTLKDFDMVFLRLGIKKVYVSDVKISEFSLFKRIFTCLSIYDVIFEQLNRMKSSIDDYTYNQFISGISNCVKNELGLIDFNITLKFNNFEVVRNRLYDKQSGGIST